MLFLSSLIISLGPTKRAVAKGPSGHAETTSAVSFDVSLPCLDTPPPWAIVRGFTARRFSTPSPRTVHGYSNFNFPTNRLYRKLFKKICIDPPPPPFARRTLRGRYGPKGAKLNWNLTRTINVERQLSYVASGRGMIIDRNHPWRNRPVDPLPMLSEEHI